MEPIDSSPTHGMTALVRPRCVASRGLSRAFSTYTLTIRRPLHGDALQGDFYGFLHGAVNLLTASVTSSTLRADGHLVKSSALKEACRIKEWCKHATELSGNLPAFRKYLLSKVEAGDPVDDMRLGLRDSYSFYGFAHSPAYPWDEERDPARVCETAMLAHSFRGKSFGPAQRMHGATILVEAWLYHHLDERDLAKALIDALKPFENQNLDTSPWTQGANTTIEWIAFKLWEDMAVNFRPERLEDGAAETPPSPPKNKKRLKIIVHESDIASCSFEGPTDPAPPPAHLGHFSVTVRDRCMIARRLDGAEDLHGATLLVDMTFKGPRLREPENFLVDIGMCQALLGEAVGGLAYRNLEEIEAMKGENWTLEMLSRYLWERVRSAYLALPPADRQSPPEPLSSLTITLSDGPDPLATSASFEGPLDTPQSGAAALLPPIAFNVDLIASAEVKAIVRRCLDSKERGGWAAIEKELTAYLLNKETARLSGQTDDRDGRKESTTPTGWQHMASEGATPRWIRDLLRWTSPGHMLFYSRCFPSSMVSRIVMPGRGGVMMVGGEAFIGEGGRGPQYERLREAWKVLGGGEKELVVIDDPEVIDSSVRAISHAIKGVSLTPLPTSPSTLEQSLASLIKCAPPQSTFHFDPLAYLSAKKAIDCHAFNEDTWEAFVARFREKEPRDCGVRVLDVGAGTLGMLVRVLGLWEGHQWKGRGDALVYVAVDTSRAVMQANRESATELMGFEEVDESFGFHPRERVYRKADRGGGTIYLVLVEGDLLDTADGQHGFDVVLGCSFADLMDQDVLINHLTRIARGALLYMPITYAGRTIFDPPFFGGGALPTDRQVVSLYHEHLRREGQSTDPSKLVRAIESRKGQIMMQGASEWSVPFADHKYMWQCLMSFLAMGALKSCELLPHWDLPAWVKHHTDKQSTVQVKNVDILGTLPADVAAAFPSRQVVFSGPSRVELRDRPQATKVPPGHVEVESAYSLISSGTELKVYQGDFIEGEPLDTAIEGMTATPLRYPLTYGYSLAGKCVRCGSGVDRLSWLGQKVFAFHSHEERAIVPLSSCTRLPPDVPVDDAIFLPAMETALSLLQDASPVPGEQVAVFGQGLIGLLVTYLLARQRWHVTAIDPSEQRRRLAREAGASAVLAPSSAHDPPSPFDCVIEVSGRPTALDGALRVTRDNGRVVVGSWYSKGFAGFAELDLGSLRLHRSHIQIKFSQVSEIPPSLRGRWTKDRRLDEALRVLAELSPSTCSFLPVQTFPASRAKEAYDQLAKGTAVLARLHWKGTE